MIPYVTIDGAEGLSDEHMQALSSRVLNLKRIRALIFFDPPFSNFPASRNLESICDEYRRGYGTPSPTNSGSVPR